mgnify:CR=1 FL=1
MDTEWKKAKIYSSNKNRSTDWSYILMVYTYLGGNKKGIEVEYEDQVYRLLGTYSDRFDILYDERDDVLTTVPSYSIMKSKKYFISVDSQDVIGYVMIDDIKGVDDNTSNLMFMKGNKIPIYKKLRE